MRARLSLIALVVLVAGGAVYAAGKLVTIEKFTIAGAELDLDTYAQDNEMTGLLGIIMGKDRNAFTFDRGEVGEFIALWKKTLAARGPGAWKEIGTLSEHGTKDVSRLTLSAGPGVRFVLASPAGYHLPAEDVDRIMSQVPDLDFVMTEDPREAVREADVIYTDTWVSMGQEKEKAQRIKDFAGFCLDEKLLAAAPKHTIVLHCLPAYRGMEISDGVVEGKQSRIFQQAENRLHFQKGLLAVLMAGA